MKKILSLLLSVLFIFSVVPAACFAASSAAQGKCGANAEWSFNESTGELTVSGTGAIYDYFPEESPAPWISYTPKITSLKISEGITSIGSNAFIYLNYLESAALPESLEKIGDMAFAYCYALENFNIPDGVTYINKKAFVGTAAYNEAIASENGIFYAGRHLIKASPSVSGEVTVKEGTKYIGDNAFEDCTYVTSVVLPDSLIQIGAYAFSGCTALDSITFSGALESIGNYAFKECKALAAIELPASLETIGDYAFGKCTKLASVTIPASVKTIGEGAFSGCTALADITLPASVINIGKEAFIKTAFYKNDANYENGALYAGVHLLYVNPDIAGGAFEIKPGTLNVASYALRDCYRITSVTVPGSVKHFCDGAFLNCQVLKSVYTDSMASWCDIVFDAYYSTPFCFAKELYVDGEKTTAITVPDGVTRISAFAFANMKFLESITLPDSLKEIGQAAFERCSGITSIVLPEVLEKIENYAFYDTGIEEFVIPDSVTEIESYAFNKQNVIVNCTSPSAAEIKKTLGKYCTVKHGEATGSFTQSATAANAGKTYKKCSVCGAEVETVELPRLKPDAVKLAKVSNTKKGVKVTWNPVSGADTYIIYRKASGETSWTRLGTAASGTKDYTDTKAKSGNTYTYTVKAQNTSGAGAYDKKGLTVLYLAEPVITVVNTDGAVNVKWEKVACAKGYYIYRKGVNDQSWTRIATIKNGSATAYSDAKAPSGKGVMYTAKAFNGSTVSSYCAGVSIRVMAQPAVAVKNGNCKVTVSWKKIAGASGYYVYRKTGSDAKWTRIADITDAAKLSFADTNVKSGTKYKYTVKAYCGSYVSSFCAGVTTLYIAPAKVSSAKSSGSGITVNWGKIGSASGYYVYRKTAGGSYAKIATVKGNTTVSYLDKTAKKGTAYTYCVRPFNGSYSGAYANAVSCKR